MRDNSKISFLKFSGFLLIAFLLFSGGNTLAKDINLGTVGDRIFLNGNVGVGTTNPGARLTLSGAANSDLMTLGTASGIFGALSANGLYGLYTGVSNDGHVWMQVGRNDASAATYPLTLNPGGGNVGIGVTNPGAKLEVAGVVSAATGATGGFRSTTYTAGQNLIWAFGNASGYGFSYKQGGQDDIRFHLGDFANPQFLIRIDGNVGIGLTAPAYKLDVNGYGNFNNFSIHNVGTPSVDSDAATQGYVKSSIGSSNLWGGTLNGNIWNGAAGAGNVGIGGTAPAVRLDVQGGTNSYGTNIYGIWTPDGNSLIRNWALNDGANNYTGSYTSVADAPLGSKTMRYSTNTYFRNAQWVPVDTTRTYKVSVWGRTISGTPNNYLSLTQAGSDLSQPSNGGWGNPYWGVVNQPFPAAWTYYTMTIGPSGSGANYVWSAGTKYIQLGALMIYTGSGVCEIAGYKIEEVENTIAYNASALGNLAVAGNVTAERFKGNNSLVLNTYATINPASNVFLYSQSNDRDSWLYLDSADTGSNWGIYHRQIDSAVSSLSANSIGFVGGGASALQASISLANGNAYFAGSVGIGNTAPSYKLDVIGNGAFRSGDNSYIYFGPNASWGGSLYVGATPNKIGSRIAQVVSSDGNLHIDSGNYAGNDIYLNYYNSGHGIRAFGPLNMNSNQINGLGTPTSASDAATKGYVDSASVGNADTLDGYHETSFLRFGANSSNPTNGNFAMGNSGGRNFIQSHSGQPLDINPLGNTVSVNGATVITAANVGSQTVSNSDMVDGIHAPSFWQDNQDRVIGTIRFTGVGGDSGQAAPSSDYRIYQAPGPWTHPYPDLNIAYHTGISIGAHYNYGGTRFFNNSDMITKIFSVGEGDNNVRVVNDLYVGGTVGATTFAGNATSATNADTVDGYHVSTGGSANTIPTRNSSGYLSPANWIQLDDVYGLYSPVNGAHFYPNNASYGSWRVQGTRNGWGGIEFSAGAGNISLMIGQEGWGGMTTGMHANNYGWLWRFVHDRLYAGGATFTGDVTASSYTYSSDQNLKKNIATIQSPLEKILQLRGVTFDWKKDGKSGVGLIAQEVEKVFPELVSSDGTNKGVQYGNLVAPLIEAVKAQQKEIEDSKNQQFEANKAQQEEINLLKAKIKTLEIKNKK